MATSTEESGSYNQGERGLRRVLIADDHDIVRRGLRSFVESRPDWQVVAEAADGLEALRLTVANRPDIAIVDYSIPLMNGAQLAHRMRTAAPDTQVLIFTMHESETVIRESLKAGARGFLLKSDTEKLLYAALDSLIRRKPFFTGAVSEALLTRYLANPGEAPDTGVLTPREKEVIQLIAEGNSSRAVGEILNISTKTVEAHRASAMAKLQISSTASLVRYAIRNKIIEP